MSKCACNVHGNPYLPELNKLCQPPTVTHALQHPRDVVELAKHHGEVTIALLKFFHHPVVLLLHHQLSAGRWAYRWWHQRRRALAVTRTHAEIPRQRCADLCWFR